jgi:hypothetical protein
MQHYLQGHPFIIETDHRNLLYLEKATAPKLIRWRLRLQEFSFKVRHIAGVSNVDPDALSRCHRLEAADAVDLGVNAKIAMHHDALVGHFGVNRTVEMLQAAGHSWPSMREDVSAFVGSCPTCQKIRLGQGSQAAAVSSTFVLAPFEVLALDTIGPLPEDKYGNKYIITAIDAFSRFVELKASPDATSLEAAKFLFELFGRYGPSRSVRTDGGSQYTAAVVDQLLSLVGADRQLTLPYFPQSNGLVERANGEVLRHLRALVMDRRLADTWSSVLPLVQRLINFSPHSALGTSPQRVIFGQLSAATARAALLPTEASSGMSSVEDFVQELIAAQQVLLAASVQHQERVLAKQLAAQPADPLGFQAGDYVLLDYPVRPPTKLAPAWRGPLVVIEKVGSNTYRCQDLVSLKSAVYPAARLKAFDASRTPDPVALAATDKDEYVIESILAHRPARAASKMAYEFLVRWQGYDASADLWLPYWELRHAAALDAYAAAHPRLRL